MSTSRTGSTANTKQARPLPEALVRFVDLTPWTFAKTYAKTWPHEYIVREKVDAALFDEFAAFIDQNGYESHFYQAKQIYLDLGSHTYWHMDNIINRCPTKDTYHRLEKEGRLPHLWVRNPKFAEAFKVAADHFAHKNKKGGGIPYISHLLGTCGIALENGANENEAIAALLHDMIEDIRPTEEAIAAVGSFGPEVLRIVRGCSDSETHPKGEWKPRKERYLEHLETADHAILLVSAADKLHNARAIVVDLRHLGASTWDRFNAPREDQLWYYKELLRIFKDRLSEKYILVAELDLAVAEMSRESATPAEP